MKRKTYKCEKCIEWFPLVDCVDILFIEHGKGGEKRQVSKVRLCKDCVEKAQVAIADALELPDWD